MRYSFLIYLFAASAYSLQAQDNTALEKGVVSYMSSQNVYVKFESTERIKIGDTLYINKENELEPILLVNNKSSISCLCTPLTSKQINVSDQIFAQKIIIEEQAKVIEEESQETPLVTIEHKPRSEEANQTSFKSNESFIRSKIKKIQPTVTEETASLQADDESVFKQKIRGRLSLASYSSVSDFRTNHKMRYAFSFRGDNLGDSRLSLENYITFRHSLNERNEVKSSLSNALRVYSLALKYDLGKASSITVGRKINPRISSMGAIDGIQFEKGLGNFQFGAILGSRPDYADYGLNLDLFQFGGYLSLLSSKKAKYHQTSLAFVEQRNNSEIDRRFLYFQHNSSLVKNLNLFTSFEIALYEKIQEEEKNTFNLVNLYASLRYRFSRKLSISASYDNRKNIVFYETYKSFIDKLIEAETRQGVRFHINYRPFKNVIWGVNTGWRFQKSHMNLSKNLNSYLTFSRISKLNLRATVTANFLQTNYLDSKVFGIRISKEIVKGILSGDLNFRVVDYRYNNYENATHQNIAGINISMNLIKKLTFYMYYEGTFDNQNTSHNRFNMKLIQRF